MIRRGNIGTFAGLGLLAEIVVFVATAERIGLGFALLLTVLTSLLGVTALKRSGASALSSLRSMAGEPLTRETALVDGMIGAIGALLLIIPGFLTDLVGLALLAPSSRQWLVRRLGVSSVGHDRPRARPGSGTIDLDGRDWTRLDNLRSP